MAPRSRRRLDGEASELIPTKSEIKTMKYPKNHPWRRAIRLDCEAEKRRNEYLSRQDERLRTLYLKPKKKAG